MAGLRHPTTQIANKPLIIRLFQATGTTEFVADFVDPFVGNPFDSNQNRAGGVAGKRVAVSLAEEIVPEEGVILKWGPLFSLILVLPYSA